LQAMQYPRAELCRRVCAGASDTLQCKQ
jgi:hypothetical protein